MFVSSVLSWPSKATANTVSSRELESNLWCDLVTSDSKQPEDDLRDEPGSVAAATTVPWENRYEKLWVEVEKRQVKSNYKNVACELKEKFGELLRPGASAEEDEEPGEPEEDSSDDEEEEGQVIVRPTARARSTVLLSIPEQRESGLEDSESPDRSSWESRKQVQEEISSSCPGPNPSSDHQQITSTKRAASSHQPGSVTVSMPGILCKSNTASPYLAEKELKHQEDPADPEGSTKLQPSSLFSRVAPVQETSPKGFKEGGRKEEDEEKQEKMFKHGVATPKVVLQDFKKEKCWLQREVDCHLAASLLFLFSSSHLPVILSGPAASHCAVFILF